MSLPFALTSHFIQAACQRDFPTLSLLVPVDVDLLDLLTGMTGMTGDPGTRARAHRSNHNFGYAQPRPTSTSLVSSWPYPHSKPLTDLGQQSGSIHNVQAFSDALGIAHSSSPPCQATLTTMTTNLGGTTYSPIPTCWRAWKRSSRNTRMSSRRSSPWYMEDLAASVEEAIIIPLPDRQSVRELEVRSVRIRPQHHMAEFLIVEMLVTRPGTTEPLLYSAHHLSSRSTTSSSITNDSRSPTAPSATSRSSTTPSTRLETRTHTGRDKR